MPSIDPLTQAGETVTPAPTPTSEPEPKTDSQKEPNKENPEEKEEEEKKQKKENPEEKEEEEKEQKKENPEEKEEEEKEQKEKKKDEPPKKPIAETAKDENVGTLGYESAVKKGEAAGKELGKMYQEVKSFVDGNQNKPSENEPGGPENESGPKMK